MANLKAAAQALAPLPDTYKFYLQPVGALPGAPDYFHGGLRLGGSALGFSGARIIARAPSEKRSVDVLIPASDLAGLVADLPAWQSARLRSLMDGLGAPRGVMAVGAGQAIAFTKPRLMGVLNVTPDSFSDGGDFVDASAATAHGRAMTAAGADIIDIGGESTRPGAEPVWEGDEKDRVVPVIEALAAEGAILSVDTRHASVMDAALKAGAHIINDISALSYDPEAMDVAARSTAPIVLMHAQGDPAAMQDNPSYVDVVLDVFDYLEARMDACDAAGIANDRLILDPGIGFGKRVIGDNLALLGALPIFHTLGRPLLIGASRKRFIGAIAGVDAPKERLPGSLAVAVQSVMQGCQIVRAHDAGETRQALALAQAYLDAGAMDAVLWSR